jgi:hypothetical protein
MPKKRKSILSENLESGFSHSLLDFRNKGDLGAELTLAYDATAFQKVRANLPHECTNCRSSGSATSRASGPYSEGNGLGIGAAR